MNLRSLFLSNQFTSPSTITIDGSERDVLVFFQEANQVQTIGDTVVQNPNPTASAMSVDVDGVNTSSSFVLHSFLVNEFGELLATQNGEEIILQGIKAYDITESFENENGITEMQLTESNG